MAVSEAPQNGSRGPARPHESRYDRVDQPAHGKGRPGAEPQRVTVLGATGSVGRNTLDLIERNPGQFNIVAVSANTDAVGLAALARQHGAAVAVVADAAAYKTLKSELSGSGIEAAAGGDALVEAASMPADCVVAAIVGSAGVKPTFAAVRQGRRVALANKECLVTGGHVFMREVRQYGTELLPVDSEHSAAFQSLGASDFSTVAKITLTASGGPFRTWDLERIANSSPAEALCHPNWTMGPKITIDSATLMNKGLELIEAFYLFPVGLDRLDVVVHPQSIVHCLVSYIDGSVLAQLANPDMRTPIALALSHPGRMCAPTPPLDLVKLASLTFEAPDTVRFPALALARDALRRGGSAPAIYNAANEIAVAAFLDGRIGFLDIAATVATCLERADGQSLILEAQSLDEVLNIDLRARELARHVIGGTHRPAQRNSSAQV